MLRHPIYNIPNVLTSINLISGVFGILFAFVAPEFVGYCILISLIMDFFDGIVARKLKIQKSIGKELDSLADIVSFGVLPSILFSFLLLKSINSIELKEWMLYLSLAPAFFIAVFSAIRLAKFNNETRSTKYFYGLNTPTNAILIFGLHHFFYFVDIKPEAYLYYYLFFIILIIMLCALLVSDIKMYSNKGLNKNVSTLFTFGFLFLTTPFIFYFFGFIAFSYAVIVYVICSFLFLNILNSNHKNKTDEI
jgi:CDP-diacylglycerol--serine O-phosphatidyltransferase